MGLMRWWKTKTDDAFERMERELRQTERWRAAGQIVIDGTYRTLVHTEHEARVAASRFDDDTYAQGFEHGRAAACVAGQRRMQELGRGLGIDIY